MIRASLVVIAVLATPAAAETKILDFEIVRNADGSTTVRDAAYELSFAGKAGGGTGTAKGGILFANVGTFDNGNSQSFNVFVYPPNDKVDGDAAVTAQRDAMLAGYKVGADTKETLDGLAFHHILADGDENGHKVFVELYIGWDEPHHTVVAIQELTRDKREPHGAFTKSFRYHKAGKAPPSKV